MAASILPFSLAKSNEKLTDRGAIAIVDEFADAIGLLEKVEEEFPVPGSNAGIAPSVYVRTLMYHFSEGGRHIEDTRQIKADEGFRSLIGLDRMPGPDAIGDWLRRMGAGDRQEQLRSVNDMLVRRYLERELYLESDLEQGVEKRDAEKRESGEESKALTLDVDATLIEAEKGDGKKAYDGTVGYQPMLGFLSDGRRRPCCSYVKFRPGNASPQTGIEEAIRHTLGLVERTGRSLRYFRSDSAAYQSGVINLLNDEGIGYTVTADLDEAVRKAIRAIPEGNWQPLEDRDGFKTSRKASETVHTMNDSDHAFRLVAWREQVEDPSLFAVADEDFYRYGAVITNVSEKEMSTEEVLYHHRGRGNAERFIGEAKSGVGLRHLPCGQERANRIWFAVGMLTFNLLKLMQQQVLPTGWKRRTIQTLRQKALRLVGKVTKSARRLTLKVRASLDQIDKLRTVRRLIYQLA
jgi:hypothetical protein